MHRIAAIPGGWQPGQEGVVFIEQDPAPLVVLTAADTDIQALAAAVDRLPLDFPAVRVANLLNLQQQLAIDTYADQVLAKAKCVVLRLLGGRSYWEYGLEVVKETIANSGAQLLVLPGDDRPDLDLMSHSTFDLKTSDRLWQYFLAGGAENLTEGLKAIARAALDMPYEVAAPEAIATIGLYLPQGLDSLPDAPYVGILLYRAHVLASNTAPIDALCRALQQRGLNAIGLFTYSLKDPELSDRLLQHFRNEVAIEVAIDTTSFSMAKLDAEAPKIDIWDTLNVQVLQAILSGGTREQWNASNQGLTPRDIAMNVALPEVDGRIVTRAVSFKQVVQRHDRLQTDVVRYEPVRDRVEFVADLAANWANLRQTSARDRRIALILANYPNRDGRLANGVGLDTPASCVEILRSLQLAGYDLGTIPSDSTELMNWLTESITNDPEGKLLRPSRQVLAAKDYRAWFEALPSNVKTQMLEQWGEPPQADIAIAGLQLGRVFIGIQPPRGYDLDPSLNYHSPDLIPPHEYLAFYAWLRTEFGVQAIAHVGKHGNVEWLPGKGIALSETCFPEVVLGALPHLYPFIVNDPGEGAQAKRRSQAVIVDHLTPPLTRAELYGSLMELEALIDEYYEAQTLDPRRLSLLQPQILELLDREQLLHDLDPGSRSDDLSELFNSIDGYLCELKEAQIRDGLHVLGQVPSGKQGINLVAALARYPGNGQLGITQAIARDSGLRFDPLTAEPGEALDHLPEDLHARLGRAPHIVGDAIEALELRAADWVEQAIAGRAFDPAPGDRARACLAWVERSLWPRLQQTPTELTALLRGFAGGFVPSGPSGAPTRGRSDVLPTGRNFYSVDIRAIPTETAWRVGAKAAETVIERFVQEQGEYPRSLGLSVWGTSTMRTGGDDWAEAMALIGVQPLWDGRSRRVIDFEILPIEVLGRPRVDVTLRISGFFRDAFPNLISLFDTAVNAVADLPESAADNPIGDRVRSDSKQLQATGLPPHAAEARARYRIFGSKPGAYGAGLQGLIESQNWDNDADLARAYLNWSSYAYTESAKSHAAPEAFAARLQNLQIVLHNQDNREHDLLDSDDYYQFQGGMVAAARSLSGQSPEMYFGDHSKVENPKVRSLSQEIARVYRSRVVNPKWIAGVMRHGYKGAFELAATVDYLFAYDATTHVAKDFMYEGIARAYLLDNKVREFAQRYNPWAVRDMSDRLLEARQRGLWKTPDPNLLEQLETVMLEAEADIEQR